VRAQAQRLATPSTRPTPRPSAAASAHGFGAVALAGPDAAWVVQPAGDGTGADPAVLMTTSDHGAHWTRRVHLPSSLAQFHTEPGGRAMLFVTDLSGPGEAGALVIYGTSDGGASWQRMPSPPGGMLATSWARDGHEAWVGKWGQPDQTGAIRTSPAQPLGEPGDDERAGQPAAHPDLASALLGTVEHRDGLQLPAVQPNRIQVRPVQSLLDLGRSRAEKSRSLAALLLVVGHDNEQAAQERHVATGKARPEHRMRRPEARQDRRVLTDRRPPRLHDDLRRVLKSAQRAEQGAWRRPGRATLQDRAQRPVLQPHHVLAEAMCGQPRAHGRGRSQGDPLLHLGEVEGAAAGPEGPGPPRSERPSCLHNLPGQGRF
jgi:hypothetical protein